MSLRGTDDVSSEMEEMQLEVAAAEGEPAVSGAEGEPAVSGVEGEPAVSWARGKQLEWVAGDT